MTGRQSMPQQGTRFTAHAVSLLLAAWFTVPANAAPNIENRCDDVADATLEISVHALKAEIVNHEVGAGSPEESDSESETDALTPVHLLAPQAEATVREVFDDATPPLAAEAASAAEDDAESAEGEDVPGINTRLPGVSDSELARYRNQMYRIDI